MTSVPGNSLGDSSRPHWSALDGLRGIAILMVVTVHFYSHATPTGTGFPIGLSIGAFHLPLDRLFQAGTFGVPIFFTLSGFLLWYPFAKAILDGSPPPSAKRFYVRRLMRIMPAYLYFVGAYLLAIAIFGKNPHDSPVTAANIAANLLFVSPVAALFNGDGITRVWRFRLRVRALGRDQ